MDKEKIEEANIVTTEKVKNVGRVEWGKKLGKIAKERKMKKEVEQPTILPKLKVDSNKQIYVVGGAVALIILGLVVTRQYFKPQENVIIKVPSKIVPKSEDKNIKFPPF